MISGVSQISRTIHPLRVKSIEIEGPPRFLKADVGNGSRVVGALVSSSIQRRCFRPKTEQTIWQRHQGVRTRVAVRAADYVNRLEKRTE